MARGTQQKLSTYKPPRVQITYDLEVNGESKTQELPFVIGVMANFSGHQYQKVKKLKNQKFIEVNKENFNNVVNSVAPKLNIAVADKINNRDGKTKIELNFTSIDDFNPGKIVNNVEDLKKLMDTRKKLLELQAHVECNEKLEETLIQFLKDPAALKQLAHAKQATIAEASAEHLNN
jgi:type VI secretion system protein ImpB